ncbi:hypothetical protein IWW55_002986 [Coemansia sp. RSA 2706]|nr:hypothetical protein IWW55_002986 [Coemansia sp. RSA 2706]
MDSVTLTLHRSRARIQLECPRELAAQTPLARLQRFPALVQWLDQLDRQTHGDPRVQISRIQIQSIDEFAPGQIGFVKFAAHATVQNTRIPGIVFLRGPSVAMLVVLRTQADQPRTTSAHDRDFVLLTEQPRVAAPDFAAAELPAGMLDASSEFAGAAAREIREETGLVVAPAELIDLNPHHAGLFPSIGACDERIRFYACEKRVSEEQLDALRGRLGGLRDHGELITLRLVRLCDLWKHTRDMKAVAALYLWDRWVQSQQL